MRAYRRVCSFATAAAKQETQYKIPTAARTDKKNPVWNYYSNIEHKPKTIKFFFRGEGQITKYKATFVRVIQKYKRITF